MKTVQSSPALTTAIEVALSRQLPLPSRIDPALSRLRELHQKNKNILYAANQATAAADHARLLAQAAVADTQVLLELLEEKLGVVRIHLLCIDVPYRGPGQDRTYWLSAHGASEGEAIGNALISEMDTDGDDIDCYALVKASERVRAASVEAIRTALAKAVRS